ncbi:AraC family transcriptional regulator, partial [Planococcus sp. SIMBA_143]
EVSQKKEPVLFSTPIVYDRILEQRVLTLAHAILHENEEAHCSELLLSLTDILIPTSLSRGHKKDNALIRKAKDMLHT